MKIEEIKHYMNIFDTELAKADFHNEVKIICYIETKNHLYKGKFNDFYNNTDIRLTDSYIIDNEESPVELNETTIKLDDESVISFSYKIITHSFK